MRSRFLKGVFVLTVVSWVAVVLADSTTSRARVGVDGVWDMLLLREYRPFDPRQMHPGEPPGFRVGDARSEARIDGFGPNAPITINVRAATAIQRAVILVVEINGVPVSSHAVGGRAGFLTIRARADARGILRLRMTPEPFGVGQDGQRPSYRLLSISVTQTQGAMPPSRRLLCYAILLALPIATIGLASRGRRWSTPALGIALSLAIVLAKPYVVASLSALVTGGVVFVALKRLLDMVTKSEQAAVLCAASVVLRVLAALHPAYPSIDATLHSHRLDTFRQGALVRNVASISEETPAPVWLPYPPLAYAILGPLARHNEDVALTRGATAIIEASAPFLLLLMCRAAGGSARAAGWVAAAACVMPEGMLVVAKGILANAMGMWAVLVAILAVLARWHPIVIAGTWILAYLGHVGSAAGLSVLAVVWIFLERRQRDSSDHRRSATIFFAMTVGLVGALFLYYWEAWDSGVRGLSMLKRDASNRIESVFFVRWIYLGKLLQNLIVKYGLLLPAVYAAFRSGAIPPVPRRMLIAWFAAGSLLSISALTSAIAFRSEYFLASAVALAAGFGLGHWQQRGRIRWIRLTLLGTMFIQILLGVVMLQAWWDPINVIIPSPRWWLAPR
ncbi:MAG: hypothetical protein JXO72_12540 [Vicinamibacteria bacterium]|nr:hypothetical protein [Vicinamibacteria bacterium]